MKELSVDGSLFFTLVKKRIELYYVLFFLLTSSSSLSNAI